MITRKKATGFQLFVGILLRHEGGCLPALARFWRRTSRDRAAGQLLPTENEPSSRNVDEKFELALAAAAWKTFFEAALDLMICVREHRQGDDFNQRGQEGC